MSLHTNGQVGYERSKKKETLHTTRYHLAKESIIKRLKRERKIIKSKYEEAS